MKTYEFSRDHDGSLSLESAVFQALGAASVCWDNMAGTGVFHSERAKVIGDALVAFIREQEKPNLGLATIRELLTELSARLIDSQ